MMAKVGSSANYDILVGETTFIELKSIIDNNWRVFSKALPRTLAVNKLDTLQKFQRINGIRNRVKVIIEYEDDYRFARSLLAELSSSAKAGRDKLTDGFATKP